VYQIYWYFSQNLIEKLQTPSKGHRFVGDAQIVIPQNVCIHSDLAPFRFPVRAQSARTGNGGFNGAKRR
jgi:hypothetical protein